ncbi:MAG: DUF2796 domain-containing protein [Thiolinea sp.]
MTKAFWRVWLLSAGLLSAPLLAKEDTAITSLAAHEHGAAHLTVATTGSGLEISLDSPAANLFGFEHLPSTPEQRQAIHDVVKTLEDGSALFLTGDKAACTQQQVEIDSAQVARHQQEQGADPAAEPQHDEHSHGVEHAEHDNGAHHDVMVLWQFDCAEPQALQQLETRLFSRFPEGFSHLQVEWLTADHAGSQVLEQDGLIRLTP